MKLKQLIPQEVLDKIKLDREEDEQSTYKEIKEGSDLSGFNLGIMGCAMIIACIGINTDSTSAEIGAMLISPLMGPIVGYSFALAIRDIPLKNSALRNWIYMTLTSLLSSTLYFLVSPFDNNTVVLQSFTQANIFDILIAFFGGMAGFIGIMKREGVKVIAGVAVATACMPPLCSAGFGLAHLQWPLFLGGLYFYFINCLFIGLATFLLSRLIGYRFKPLNHSLSTLSKVVWGVFIALMIVPGIIIAWQKWKQEKNKTETFVSQSEKIKQLEAKVKTLDSILLRNKQ